MDIEKRLNDLARLSEFVEYYSSDFDKQLEYMIERARVQQEIIDYVKGLEEDAWKYRDAQE